MTKVFSVGTRTRLTAFHQMPVEGPEGVLHSHDYAVDVEVASSQLDASGMVVDLDVLREALATTTAALEGTNLEFILEPGEEAVTVETFAKWIHKALSERVPLRLGHLLSVRVWESETEFGGFSAAVGGEVAEP